MANAVWLAWFCFYLLGLSPSLGGEDSGEFASAAAGLGISHPPGYPLYALAGRLVAVLPAGSVAFRLNLLSAAAAAAACAVLFALAFREARERFGLGSTGAVACGAVASLSMGLTNACWYQASISDKYAVNLALFGAVMAGMLSGGRWALLGLATGIGFAHHLQTLYLLPGLAWAASRVPRPSARTLGVCAVAAIAGLSPKLIYPPVRSAQSPTLMLDRPVTLGRMIGYLRARDYAKRVAGPSAGARWAATLGELAKQTSAGVPGALCAAGVLGCAGWSAVAPAATALWLTIATGLALAASLDITGREFYLLPVVWCLAFGAGMLAARSLASGRRGWMRTGAVAAAVLPAFLAVGNRHALMRGRLSLELDYGRNLLAGLPPRAVLFIAEDDSVYPVFYLQIVEGFRTDVVAVPGGFLSRPYARERLARALPEAKSLYRPAWSRDEESATAAVAREAASAGRAVALTNPAREEVSRGLNRGIRDVVYEIFRKTPAIEPDAALWLRTRGWDHDPRGLTVRQGWILSLYGSYQRQYADLLSSRGRVPESLIRYRRALAIASLPDREGAENNYALALERAGRPADALAVWGRLMAAGAGGPEVWLNAANLLLSTGRREEARAAYEAVLARSDGASGYAAYARRRLAAMSRPK